MEEFLKLCKKQLEESSKVIEIMGDTLEECLTVASENLNLPREQIDYQIISKSQRFFFYKVPYHIRAFSVFNSAHSLDKTDNHFRDFSNIFSTETYLENETKIQNGKFFIQWHKKKGVYLKVTEPGTEGTEVKLQEVQKALLERGVEKYDKNKVSKCIKNKDNKFIHISNMQTNQSSGYKIKMDRDNVKATLILKKPLYKEANLTLSDLEIEILSRRIITPIDKKVVQYHLNNHIFSTPFTVTEGKQPIHGKNSYIKFHIDINKKPKFLLNSEKKQIDYKEASLIENVSKDQLLAEKIEATLSKKGSDVFGNKIYTEDGKDIYFEHIQGKETYIDKKTNKLYASTSGQVIYADGKLRVEPIYEVYGDVGPKTGNINFNGSVIIHGNILDNYSVKSKKSIEVIGTVQKATLEAEENITIQGGCSGKSEVISLKESVFVKFIQSSNVSAYKNIFVSQGIINSNVNAGIKIVCFGKKSSIIGGFIKVKELIIASNLGSDTAPKTVIEMGYSPNLIKEKYKLEENIQNLLNEYKKLKKDIKTTEERKEADVLSFDEEEQNKLKILKEEYKKLEIKIKNDKEHLEKFNIEFIKQGFNSSKLYIKQKLFSNVHISIKKTSLTSNNTKKQQGFYFEEASELKFKTLASLELQQIINSIIKEK